MDYDFDWIAVDLKSSSRGDDDELNGCIAGIVTVGVRIDVTEMFKIKFPVMMDGAESVPFDVVRDRAVANAAALAKKVAEELEGATFAQLVQKQYENDKRRLQALGSSGG